MVTASHPSYVLGDFSHCDHVPYVLGDFGHGDRVPFFLQLLQLYHVPFFNHDNRVPYVFDDFSLCNCVPFIPLDLGDSSLCTPCPHNFIFHHTSYSTRMVFPFVCICSCAPWWFNHYSTSTSISSHFWRLLGGSLDPLCNFRGTLGVYVLALFVGF